MKVPKNAKRIVVVHNAKLGDMVCATPVFRAIRKHIPDAHLIVIGDSKQNLLSGNLDIDEYIVFEKRFFKLLRTLYVQFDFGCVLAG